MVKIVSASREGDTVTVTIEGEAVVGPNTYPWELTLMAPDALYFKSDGTRRTRAEILSLLKSYVFSELVA